jgi:hypothetical protein
MLWKESFRTNLLPAFIVPPEYKNRKNYFVNHAQKCEISPMGNIAISLGGGVFIMDNSGLRKYLLRFPDSIYEKGMTPDLRSCLGIIKFIDSKTLIYFEACAGRYFILKINKEV